MKIENGMPERPLYLVRRSACLETTTCSLSFSHSNHGGIAKERHANKCTSALKRLADTDAVCCALSGIAKEKCIDGKSDQYPRQPRNGIRRRVSYNPPGYELCGTMPPPGPPTLGEPCLGRPPDAEPVIWKSGLESSTSGRGWPTGRRPMGPCCGPPYAGIGGGAWSAPGLQRGLTPRCEMEVKVERSESAGLREPEFISSYEDLLCSCMCGGRPPGGRGVAAEDESPAKRGSTSS